MKEVKIIDILEFLNQSYEFTFNGNKDGYVEGFCSVFTPKKNNLTWIRDCKKFDFSKLTKDMNLLIIVNRSQESLPLAGFNIIECDTPKEIFFTVLDHFYTSARVCGISSDSVVKTNSIGENVYIGNNCYIGKEVTIGNNVTIDHNVTIDCKVEIGDNSIIHSGVVIGTDGFGYFRKSDNSIGKVPHFGGVIIGKNVEIGANTCIDRGTMNDTVIKSGTKIDNLCHIAHNVVIGKNVLVTAHSVICGSVVVGDNAYIAPCAAILNQTTLGENSMVGLGAVVTKDVPDFGFVLGNPARQLPPKENREV